MLATTLDVNMILGRGKIHERSVPDGHLPIRSGLDVSIELGGRSLIRYVIDPSETYKTGPTFVCPTPYGVKDVCSFLALPNPTQKRRWVVLIDPKLVNAIQGPRYCAMGQGIEYILTDGYPSSAILHPPWAIELH